MKIRIFWKIWFFLENLIFFAKFDFFLQNFNFLNFEFLARICTFQKNFDKNFNFRQRFCLLAKFWFFIKISINTKKSRFLTIFQFLTKATDIRGYFGYVHDFHAHSVLIFVQFYGQFSWIILVNFYSILSNNWTCQIEQNNWAKNSPNFSF